MEYFDDDDPNSFVGMEGLYAGLLDAATSIRFDIIEGTVNQMIRGYGSIVSDYSSSDVLDWLKTDALLARELKYLGKKADKMSMAATRSTAAKKRLNVFRLKKVAAIHLKNVVRTVDIPCKVARHPPRRMKWKHNRARKLSRIVRLIERMISHTTQTLLQRAAELERICIDDEEDYEMAIKAKNAGFAGTLQLNNALSVAVSNVIEEDAIKKGFRVRLAGTLSRKRKRVEDGMDADEAEAADPRD